MIINSNMQLKTLRAYFFALGSWLTNHSRNKILKISLLQKRRAWMDSLFEHIKNSQLSYKYHVNM